MKEDDALAFDPHRVSAAYHMIKAMAELTDAAAMPEPDFTDAMPTGGAPPARTTVQRPPQLVLDGLLARVHAHARARARSHASSRPRKQSTIDFPRVLLPEGPGARDHTPPGGARPEATHRPELFGWKDDDDGKRDDEDDGGDETKTKPVPWARHVTKPKGNLLHAPACSPPVIPARGPSDNFGSWTALAQKSQKLSDVRSSPQSVILNPVQPDKQQLQHGFL